MTDRPRKLNALSNIPPVATWRSPSRETSIPAIGPLKPLATITGSAYGLSPFFRVSFATSEETLAAAMDAIADAVRQLSTDNH